MAYLSSSTVGSLICQHHISLYANQIFLTKVNWIVIVTWPDSSIRRRLAQFTYTIISRAEARSQLWCITSIKLLLCALSSNLKQKLFYNHTFLSCLNLLLCSCITYSRQDFQEWNVGAIETSNCSYMLSCIVPFAYPSEKCLDNTTIKLTPNEIHASAIMDKKLVLVT